ncbi:exosortase family protein XrtF [Flavobacterium agricola]|uniref:Exosortase family protein XrtF n=1 Tax=Flavobacterium agricola TaxID=2870839 RepID=A0ABY6LWK1_9FLAO|nr:exosortase family protein XrtF [Flavobacterium agricola]UYW00641.1 exosortase family protein XrtF [Flavobacterium agricola]
MKELFAQYKPFFLFLAKFIGAYIILLLIYKAYLNSFDAANFETDSMTVLVAEQCNAVLNFFGYESYITPDPNLPSMNLYHGPNDFYVRVVEGCNAISVMILFASFCIAFSAYFMRTLVYIIFGVLFIHVLNIIRICLIVVLVVKYPSAQRFLHDIAFPIFIYGVVLLLWFLWIFKFSGYAKKYFPQK